MTAILSAIITMFLALARSEVVKSRLGDWCKATPRSVQWLVPLAFGALVAAGQAFVSSGGNWEAVARAAVDNGAEIGGLAIAIWHVYKRVREEIAAKPYMVFVLAGLGLGNTGCAGTLEESRGQVRFGGAEMLSSDSRCQELSDRQAVWGGVTAGTAFLAGASGLGTIKTEGTGDTVLAITAVTAGTMGAISTYLTQDAATTYVRECAR